MQKIAIVTDSTADFPLSYYEENDVSMVPLIVRFGDEAYRDWIDMPPDIFYKRLRTVDVLPKTSQPSVQEFVDVYNKYDGYDHIFSVHLSSKLSGTYQSASIAAQSVKTPVTVIDTKQATAGTGMIVDVLVKGRQAGKSVQELTSIAEKMADTVRIIFIVDTFKYLEMGGRIGKASALAGSLLNIKPLLTLEDGIVAPLKKTRGMKKALQETASFLKEYSGGKPLVVALMHADNPELLMELETGLKNAEIEYDVVRQGRVGCVIGTYVGPETIAVLFYPKDLLEAQ